MPILLIYTRTGRTLITKADVDWTIWQNKLFWFLTSLEFDQIQSCADFLQEDWHLKESSSQYIIDTVLNNSHTTFELIKSDDNGVQFLPLTADLLQTNGEVIDWEEWAYLFSKLDDRYELWVYLGGIAEQARQIVLSASQKKCWQDNGNDYIRQLVADLRQLNSPAYAIAIQENRKML